MAKSIRIHILIVIFKKRQLAEIYYRNVSKFDYLEYYRLNCNHRLVSFRKKVKILTLLCALR